MLTSFICTEFAYSKAMQLILLLLTILINLLYGYIMTNIILSLFNVKAGFGKKLLFSISTYLLSLALMYLAYAINNLQPLSDLVFLLVTMPNPLVSLICYFGYVKILRLSKYRSIHMAVFFYLCTLVHKALTRIIGLALSQKPGPYNYLLDAVSLLKGLVVSLAFYLLLSICIKRFSLGIKLSDRIFIKSIPRELLRGFFVNCLAYAFIIIFPFALDSKLFVFWILAVFLSLCVIIYYYRITVRAMKLELQNKSAYIQSLSASTEEIRGIRHDFYNILQSYSGYIQLGDLKNLKAFHETLINTTVTAGEHLGLTEKMEENPALIALLIDKQKTAQELAVDMRFSISCGLSNLYINNMNLCRVLGCLLDNAIESAGESAEKTVSFSIGNKSNGNILIVISNSTKAEVDVDKILSRGYTTKDNHQGLGLSQVRNILARFGNCIFHLECYDRRFSTYIEICPASGFVT